MKRTLILFFLILYGNATFSQVNDVYKNDGITTSLHKANIGRITFMEGNIPLEKYTASDFLTSAALTKNSNLNIRVFMANSVANYLHSLAPDVPIDELLSRGNLQFAFYVEGKLIYKENIHHGCGFGSGGSKNTSTTFRVPLTSTKGEDWWAMYMWERFKTNGGDKALTDGTHKLKIEIRPYVTIDVQSIKTGELIASGEIRLIIKTPVITREQIAVQPLQPGSDWEISTLPFDKKKIEELNLEIAKDNLKCITSIVVIRENKLMLEEYFNDANRNTLHDTRSATKSVTSTLMGIAIKDGHITNENQKLSDFYDLKQFKDHSLQKENVTLKDLLTMSSAFEGSDTYNDSPGNEENMYPTDDWVKFALNLPMDKAKTNGGMWDYFTAGVVLLGDILNKKVPGGLEKYADEKLFKPLGNTDYKWQYTPQKVVNTAGSLQMTSLDYAKYAQLYKNNGVWNGKQLLPETWVQKTLTRQIPITGRENQFYSYLFWNKTIEYNGKSYEMFYCAGNGGNQFVIFKDIPLVIIITSKAYNRPYGHPNAERIVKEYILPAIMQ
ncbi:MAG: serine hydrolase domain-containing protein [Flavobacterium sp.]